MTWGVPFGIAAMICCSRKYSPPINKFQWYEGFLFFVISGNKINEQEKK
jgi:hypothetical protein